MVISRTPLRVSFFGGGTDYPDYFMRKKAAVLGTTIDKYIFITINRGSPFFDHKIRVSYSRNETVGSVSEIAHPSVRATLQYLGLDDYLDIHSFADLPAKTGLGSSSAFTVGLLNACYGYLGTFVGKQRLAEEAIHVEAKLLRENVGVQDQAHAAFGGFNVVRADSDGLSVTPVVCSTDNKALLQKSVMLFYTGMTRLAPVVVQEQIDRTRSMALDEYLDRMYAQVGEALQLLSSKEGTCLIDELGALLDEAWTLKKRLSSQMSNATIDEEYQAARRAGAVGGKLVGAGSGGFLMIMAHEKDQAAVRQALRRMLEVRFQFEKQGSAIIHTEDPPKYTQMHP